MKTLIAFLITLVSLNVFSAELDGIKFDDKIKVDNKELVLNGIGIRKATILKIKVYYGALYLEAKSKDPSAFIATTSPKQITMHFVRDVDAKKLRDAFNEGMEAANKNHATYQQQMERFNSFVPDVVKNDLILVTFLSDGVVISAKGKMSEKIGNGDFSRALLNIWFTNPRDENLKSGLLGL
jgi:hypothetical protein